MVSNASEDFPEPDSPVNLIGAFDTAAAMVENQPKVQSAFKTGRGVATVPIFLLVPQVKLRKRLDLARDAVRAVDGLPGMVVAKWGDRSPG